MEGLFIGRFKKISEISVGTNKNIIISLDNIDKKITIAQEKVFETDHGVEHVYMKNSISLELDSAIMFRDELDKAIEHAKLEAK